MVSTNLWKARSICNKRIPPWKSYQKHTKTHWTVIRRINSKYLQLRKHNVFAKEILHFYDCGVGAVTRGQHILWEYLLKVLAFRSISATYQGWLHLLNITQKLFLRDVDLESVTQRRLIMDIKAYSINTLLYPWHYSCSNCLQILTRKTYILEDPIKWQSNVSQA